MPLLNVVIDLYHNDQVDAANGFHAIKGAGILGVIHKATQGTDAVDPEYDERRHRALSVGLLWGAYHFGIAADGGDQADHFMNVNNPTAGELMVLDFEPNATAGTMSVDQAEAFVAQVQSATGRYPVLYSGQSFLQDQLSGVQPEDTILAQCPLWIARYGPHLPQVPSGFPDFSLWQYTDGAVGLQPHSVPGVGRCDRNKFNGTSDQLTQFWQ